MLRGRVVRRVGFRVCGGRGERRGGDRVVDWALRIAVGVKGIMVGQGSLYDEMAVYNLKY